MAVDLSARYEQYGMSEKALWDRIYEMDEWWRESTWYVFRFLSSPFFALFSFACLS